MSGNALLFALFAWAAVLVLWAAALAWWAVRVIRAKAALRRQAAAAVEARHG